VFVGSRVDFLFILGFLLSVSVDFWYWLALLFVVAAGKFTSFFFFSFLPVFTGSCAQVGFGVFYLFVCFGNSTMVVSLFFF
jgi:hypothetical protein